MHSVFSNVCCFSKPSSPPPSTLEFEQIIFLASALAVLVNNCCLLSIYQMLKTRLYFSMNNNEVEGQIAKWWRKIQR